MDLHGDSQIRHRFTERFSGNAFLGFWVDLPQPCWALRLAASTDQTLHALHIAEIMLQAFSALFQPAFSLTQP